MGHAQVRAFRRLCPGVPFPLYPPPTAGNPFHRQRGAGRIPATFTVFTHPSPKGIYKAPAIILDCQKRTVTVEMTEKDEDCSWEEMYASCGCDPRYD